MQATFASKVEVKDDKLGVTREIDGGLEMIDVKMPCVITADLRYDDVINITINYSGFSLSFVVYGQDVNVDGLTIKCHSYLPLFSGKVGDSILQVAGSFSQLPAFNETLMSNIHNWI